LITHCRPSTDEAERPLDVRQGDVHDRHVEDADDEPGSQLELAVACGKAPALVVNMVDVLADKGLVRRERDPKDRRRSVVRLTGDGREVLARADEVAAQVEAELLGGLSAAEREQLHTLLRRALEAPAGG